MKKIFALVYFMTLSLVIVAQGGVNFFEGTFKEAIAKAQNENKMIFVDCYTSWCGPCKRLAKEIFPTKVIGDYMNGKYVSLKIDMEKGEGPQLAKKWNISSYPTLLVFNAKGREINRMVGATLKPEAFIAELKKISQESNSIITLKEKYEQDIKYADDYLRAVAARGVASELTKAMLEIFKRRTPEQRYDANSFKLYDTNILYLDDEVAAALIADKKNVIKYLGKNTYFDFLESKLENTISRLYMNDFKGGVHLDQCEAFVKVLKNVSELKDSFYYKYFMTTYADLAVRDIASYFKNALLVYPKANDEQKFRVTQFSYRHAITNRKTDLLLDFYKKILPMSSKDSKLKEMIEKNIERFEKK